MASRFFISAGTLFLAFSFVLQTSSAVAQADSRSSSESWVEVISRQLDRMGEKTRQLLPTAFNPLGGDPAESPQAAQASRSFSQNYPLRSGSLVSISNEFGEVRVESWPNPVVQVAAEIKSGADSDAIAQELVNTTVIDVVPNDMGLSIRTVYPDSREKGDVTKSVNYVIKLPSDVSLQCRNSFGDVFIQGINGQVTLAAEFGLVELENLKGETKVRARGEFPLRAKNLAKGGVFELRRTQAEFTNVAGSLQIASFLGSVSINEPAQDLQAHATCDMGSALLLLSDDLIPALEASVRYGELHSDVPLVQVVSGDLLVGRHDTTEPGRRIMLDVSFGDIDIRRVPSSPAVPSLPGVREEPTIDIIEREYPLGELTMLSIHNMNGDIRVEGTDEEYIRLKATRKVKMTDRTQTSNALECIRLAVEPLPKELSVRTSIESDPTALGCSQYRIDLSIECPRTITVSIHGADGQTMVEGLGGGLICEQSRGRIAIQHIKGDMRIVCLDGNVEVSDCEGPLDARIQGGSVSTKNIYTNQTIECDRGRTVVEAPRGEIIARQQGGDVRIIPLDGIYGNMNVTARNGDISILVPQDSDATFWATAHNGVVRPAFPMKGEVGKDYHQLQGKPPSSASGRFEVILESYDGNIVID